MKPNNKADWPTNDWNHVEILDAAVAEPSGHSRCEFCGQRIRWMHILEHDEYDRTMRAGCCCAEKYCNDYDAAGAEKAMKARAGRRRTFANLERWRPSRYNAENRVRKHRCVDGTKLRVTIFRAERGYRLSFAEVGSDERPHFPPDTFATQQEAALAAFDLIEAASKEEEDDE
jgi:hypothetical protein